MVNAIIRKVIEELSHNGIKHIYSTFDNANTKKMHDCFSTAVSLNCLELKTPLFSESAIITPYKADIDLRVTTPEEVSIERLEKYYSCKLKFAIMDILGISWCISRVGIAPNAKGTFELVVSLTIKGIVVAENGKYSFFTDFFEFEHRKEIPTKWKGI